MNTTPNRLRFTVLAGMILAAAAFRLLPHPPNFSPIAALALFGGAQFTDKRAAFLVPLAAMFLGDLVLGLHALIPVTRLKRACLRLAEARRSRAVMTRRPLSTPTVVGLKSTEVLPIYRLMSGW